MLRVQIVILLFVLLPKGIAGPLLPPQQFTTTRPCATPLKEEAILVQLAQSLCEKLKVSAKTKRIPLPLEFCRSMGGVFIQAAWRDSSRELTHVIAQALQNHRLDSILNDRNKHILIVQVITKWRSEDLPKLIENHSNEAERHWNRTGPKGALTRKILDDWELSLWLKRRGPFASNTAVAAILPISLINRTQWSVSAHMRDLQGEPSTIFEVAAQMKKSGYAFDPLGAPDVVPIFDPVTGTWRFATLDHRRIMAARWADIEKILMKIHRPESPFPERKGTGSTRFDIRNSVPYEGFQDGRERKIEPREFPQTWEEAVVFACSHSRMVYSLSLAEFPNTGLPGLPPYPSQD